MVIKPTYKLVIKFYILSIFSRVISCLLSLQMANITQFLGNVNEIQISQNWVPVISYNNSRLVVNTAYKYTTNPKWRIDNEMITSLTTVNSIIRVYPWTSYTKGLLTYNNSIILIDSNSYVNISYNNIQNSLRIYDRLQDETEVTAENGDEYILDGCFGYGNNEVYLLLNNTNGYILLYLKVSQTGFNIDRSSVIEKKYIIISKDLIKKNVAYSGQMQYNKQMNKVFILFSHFTVAFTKDDSTRKLKYVGIYEFYNNDIITTGDLRISHQYSDFLVIVKNYTVKVLNATESVNGRWKVLFQYTNTNFQIFSAEIKVPLLYVGCKALNGTNYVIQIDFLSGYDPIQQIYTGTIMTTFSIASITTISDYKVRFSQQSIFVWYPLNQLQMISALKADVKMNSVAGSCSSTTFAYNSSDNKCYRKNETILTSLPYQPTQEIEEPSSPALQALIDILSGQQMQTFFFYFSTSITYSRVSGLVAFVMAQCNFLDDLYYYRYHKTEHSETFKLVLDLITFGTVVKMMKGLQKFVDQAQTALLFSWTTSPIYVSIQEQADKQLHFYLITYPKYEQQYATGPPIYTQLQQINFLTIVQEIYINQLMFTLLIQSFLFIIRLLLGLYCGYFKSLKGIKFFYTFLKRQTAWYAWVAAYLQSCIYKISFAFFVNLQLPSSFTYENKFSLFVSFLFLFITILFSLTFYSLIKQNKGAKQLLDRTKKSTSIGPFEYESFIRFFRNITRGCIQGFLVNNYFSQILSLCFLDISCLIAIILFRKFYVNRLMLTYNIVYCFSLLFLDVKMFTKELLKWSNKSIHKNIQSWLDIFPCAAMLITAFLFCITMVWIDLYSVCKKYLPCCGWKKIQVTESPQLPAEFNEMQNHNLEETNKYQEEKKKGKFKLQSKLSLVQNGNRLSLIGNVIEVIDQMPEIRERKNSEQKLLANKQKLVSDAQIHHAKIRLSVNMDTSKHFEAKNAKRQSMMERLKKMRTNNVKVQKNVNKNQLDQVIINETKEADEIVEEIIEQMDTDIDYVKEKLKDKEKQKENFNSNSQ